MLSLLPDLTPRDSHSLWYTSSRNPHQAARHAADFSLSDSPSHPPRGRAAAAAVERTALARLRADEAYMERRRLNVSNFGATWLKPPGVAKSLFQLREERREQEEHAEAMRREQLAQELAEAETEAGTADAAGIGAGGLMGGEEDGLVGEPMDEDTAGGERDLDDDIPDADGGGFGYDGASDEDEDETEEEEEEEEEEEGEEDNDEGEAEGGDSAAVPQLGRAQQRELASRMASVRAAEDRARELMVRGQDVGSGLYDGEEDIEGEDQEHMLEEDDLLQLPAQPHEVELGADMDMDVNLDDDIPEAESGGYEHTDTEADLSSSDDDDDDDDGDEDDDDNGGGGGGGLRDASFTGPRALRSSRFRESIRSDVTGSSIDVSSLLSRDGSSVLGSSPQIRRRN